MPAFDLNGVSTPSWYAAGEQEVLDKSTPTLVSLTRFLEKNEPGVGILLDPDADLKSAAHVFGDLEHVGIKFASFKDGRVFSLARLLRSRYGFRGDLRAYGPLLPDQGAFLARCGFTSFDVVDGFDQAALRYNLTHVTHVYQLPSGAAKSIVSLRQTNVVHESHQNLQGLVARYRSATAQELLSEALTRDFPGRIALVSSFGAESAVLLHMLSRIKPDTPVIFLDTGKLFGETLRFRNALTSLLRLTRVESVTPESATIAGRDPTGALWSVNADSCCELRKVEPLTKALRPFAAWVTGRKAYQSNARSQLPNVELVDGKFKFNPLASWTRADVVAYLDAHGLPRHPLEADGYTSIGCTPCTSRTVAGEDLRAGRWRGDDKTECGIHVATNKRAAS